jgi:hypothetical protein
LYPKASLNLSNSNLPFSFSLNLYAVDQSSFCLNSLESDDNAFIAREIVLPDDLPLGKFGDEVPHMEEEEKTNE